MSDTNDYQNSPSGKIMGGLVSVIFGGIGLLALYTGDYLRATSFISIAIAYYLARFHRQDKMLYNIALVLGILGVVLAIGNMVNVFKR
jgi:hypothetical protein